ncbi:dihydroorotase [Desulfospira joergensenii]|uniref:dihydroorotase n=1 Tax=Desulfospira joergensenii TaxID=53329 RepID=UPI0003B6211C|nr:dihydroorotase [Desulfospira joergensenii]
MQMLIKNAGVIDPGNLEGKKDILIQEGRIEAILDPGQPVPDKFQTPELQIVDAPGMILTPGLIDVHVHLREPGHEYKETVETGLKAAARGGFTAVCSMPNTKPVNDNGQVTSFIISQGKKAGAARVYPAGAVSVGSLGKTLAEIHDMKRAGIRAVTDDGMPVENPQLMRRALEYCKGLNIPVLVHAEDRNLAAGGAMNEGPRATLLGIPGIPNAAESAMVVRDIGLAELTGAHVHFCHISTAESVEAVRQAKKRGANVTCETAPHYFTLTDRDIKEYDTNFKMNPPLRSEKDRDAIIQGLIDGTIDMIATDHAPHSIDEKDLEFDRAAFGIIGLETALPLALDLVREGRLSMEDLILKLSKNPARLMGVDNDLKPGAVADVTLIDPDAEYTIDPEDFLSKSRNTPFGGMKVRGNIFMTLVDGKIVYQR